MSAKKTGLKIVKWAATGLLTTGAVIAIGILSYCGMLVISPSLTLAWIAFALAGFIDGEVYLQNIGNGIDNLKLAGYRGIDTLIIHALDQQVKKGLNQPSELVKQYAAQKKYVESFKHKKLNPAQKKAKKEAIKRLRRMQKMFVDRVLSEGESTDASIILIRQSLPTFKRKIWYLRLSLPICIGSGAAFGLATAAALQTTLLGMTAALSVTIWPLAALAAVAYAFLIYQTISDMVRNETIIKWRKQFVTWFHRDRLENGDKKPIDSRYILRIVGVSFLLGLTISIGIIATLATAGTWWLPVKHAASLLPIAASGANLIRNILVPLATAATLVFTIRNSIKTVKEMVHDIQTKDPLGYLRRQAFAFAHACQDLLRSDPIAYIKQKKAQYANNKSWAELFNPFRLLAAAISAPFLFLVFIGHIAAVGLTGDRAPGLNYVATIFSAVFGALSDGFVDYHYVIGHKHETKEGEAHKHDAEDEEQHSHGMIANFILKVALSPLLLMASGWDYVVEKKDPTLSAKERFTKIVKTNFGIHEHTGTPDNEPQLTRAYLDEEMQYRFEKQKKRLKHVFLRKDIGEEKRETLDRLKTQLLSENRNLPDKNTYEATLKKPRGIFSSHHLFASQCKTEKIVNSVLADYMMLKA